ncbi:MAG: hypothetical protein QXQ43_00535 [Nitrososphaerota archaeon]
MKKEDIDIKKLKSILEDPSEPITPSFIIPIIDALFGLNSNDHIEIDFVWLKLESKYGIHAARKDSISASLAFYYNPSEFFMNPNVFDKMSIAFNGHNIVPTIINQPSPEEATFAVAEARNVMKYIWKHKYAEQYPLFPDVAKYIAAIYHHNGLIVFHPTLKGYQEVLNEFDVNPEVNDLRKKIFIAFKEYQRDPDQFVKDEILNKNKDNDFLVHNLAYLIAIDIYTETLLKYSSALLMKVKK